MDIGGIKEGGGGHGASVKLRLPNPAFEGVQNVTQIETVHIPNLYS